MMLHAWEKFLCIDKGCSKSSSSRHFNLPIERLYVLKASCSCSCIKWGHGGFTSQRNFENRAENMFYTDVDHSSAAHIK